MTTFFFKGDEYKNTKYDTHLVTGMEQLPNLTTTVRRVIDDRA